MAAGAVVATRTNVEVRTCECTARISQYRYGGHCNNCGANLSHLCGACIIKHAQTHEKDETVIRISDR